MGLDCPSGFSRPKEGLPVFNMVVVGFKHSGKSSIIATLGTDRENTESVDNSLGQNELNLCSFTLKNAMKVITFEICSPAVKTWKYYYPNAHILLFVIDSDKLQAKDDREVASIGDSLREIDQNISDLCKVVVVFNKIDLLPDKTTPGIDRIIAEIADLEHQIMTIKLSASTGEGIDQLAQDLISIHHIINL